LKKIEMIKAWLFKEARIFLLDKQSVREFEAYLKRRGDISRGRAGVWIPDPDIKRLLLLDVKCDICDAGFQSVVFAGEKAGRLPCPSPDCITGISKAKCEEAFGKDVAEDLLKGK